jgi:hypothetical protein
LRRPGCLHTRRIEFDHSASGCSYVFRGGPLRAPSLQSCSVDAGRRCRCLFDADSPERKRATRCTRWLIGANLAVSCLHLSRRVLACDRARAGYQAAPAAAAPGASSPSSAAADSRKWRAYAPSQRQRSASEISHDVERVQDVCRHVVCPWRGLP